MSALVIFIGLRPIHFSMKSRFMHAMVRDVLRGLFDCQIYKANLQAGTCGFVTSISNILRELDLGPKCLEANSTDIVYH